MKFHYEGLWNAVTVEHILVHTLHILGFLSVASSVSMTAFLPPLSLFERLNSFIRREKPMQIKDNAKCTYKVMFPILSLSLISQNLLSLCLSLSISDTVKSFITKEQILRIYIRRNVYSNASDRNFKSKYLNISFSFLSFFMSHLQQFHSESERNVEKQNNHTLQICISKGSETI